MPKPTIVLADTDTNYLGPLQRRFIEEFYEKIELVVISDSSWFADFFSSPQQADVLVVSENLYSPSLQRHNIGNIFVLTEQHEEEMTDDLKINRILKYTSLKEIFNEIVSKSEALRVQGSEVKECQIVLISSACGGTGKTTVALGISASLTRSYKRVLYINAGRLQSFQRVFRNQSPIYTSDVYVQLGNAHENIYEEIRHQIRKEQFDYLPPFKASLISLGLPFSIYEKIAVSARNSGNYDYILLDADSSFDEDAARLYNTADKVIVVTNQTEASLYATNLLVSNINGINADKYSFICNDFDQSRDNAVISSRINLKFLINDYVEHFDHYDRIDCDEYSRSAGIQRTAFLLM